MKKWFKFFCLSFFCHKIAKEGSKCGYTNFFIAFILALAFLWVGFIGGDMLPFGAHYANSPDFGATARAVFANPDLDKRISGEVDGNLLKVKKHGGEYVESLLINTFESEIDKQNYSVNGYQVIVDSRPSNTLAEVQAYCISNDGKNLEITYEEYLTLSEVAKLNFDFKLRYTGNALELNDTLVESYKAYLNGLSGESKVSFENLNNDLAQSKITKAEYDREVYQLYFTNYYPAITDYEATSKVPLLRNYYYHKYISAGANEYLFVFDDYLSGAFKTANGIVISFYGFYGNMENGVLIAEDIQQSKANALVDKFIKDSFKSITFLNLYVYAMNTINLAPFIALMPMVVTLLAYSLLKLRGVESITSFGSAFKIIGSFVWFSALISAILTVIIAFFVQRNIINALPLVLFFIALAIRSIIFAVKEAKSYAKQLQQQESMQTEV